MPKVKVFYLFKIIVRMQISSSLRFITYKESQRCDHQGDPAAVVQQGGRLLRTGRLAKKGHSQGRHDNAADLVFEIF